MVHSCTLYGAGVISKVNSIVKYLFSYSSSSTDLSFFLRCVAVLCQKREFSTPQKGSDPMRAMVKKLPRLLPLMLICLALSSCTSPELAEVSPSPSPAPSVSLAPSPSSPSAPPSSSTRSTASASAPTSSPTAIPATQATAYVYVSQYGTKYHSSSTCSNMKTARQITKDDATASGYTACSKCW